MLRIKHSFNIADILKSYSLAHNATDCILIQHVHVHLAVWNI